MATPSFNLSEPPDAELWQAVMAGDASAFEKVVIRYQGVVSAIAYSRLGDLEASQDVAQETFWVAWSSRDQLRDPARLPAWLCGIARNLSHQETREALRLAGQSPLELTQDPGYSADPLGQSIEAEQAAIVWQAVNSLPEHYRDVMLMYYRQEHSVGYVAAALELSEEAVKQRLSRARAMLRDELVGVIEESLVYSRPGKSFTAKVMAGLVAMGVVSQATKASAASAAGIASVASAAGIASVAGGAGGALLGKAAGGATASLFSGGLLGLLGGLAGGLGGLGGAWLGTYLPAELAPTETERRFLRASGRKTLWLAIGYIVFLFALIFVFMYWIKSVGLYLIGLSISTLVFLVLTIARGFRIQKEIQAIRARLTAADDPNTSSLKQRVPWLNQWTQKRMVGRKYTSQWKLAGWPLINVQFADQMVGKKAEPLTARGWLAMGDHAYGLIAFGGRAVGLVALGGMAAGGIAMGGATVGLISVGGAALGGIALGGGAIGVIAFGGGAIGWQAAGGAALAIDKAFGGVAVAWNLAGGGYALAHELAAGGDGSAAEFNTPMAKQAVDSCWLKRGMEAFRPYMWSIYVVGVIPVILGRLSYRFILEPAEEES